MKKYIVLAVVLVACFAFVGSALAATAITGATSLGTSAFQPSTNVKMNTTSTATAYSVTGQHASSTSTNGGKQYGSLNTSATISSKTATDSGAPDATSDATALPSGFQ